MDELVKSYPNAMVICTLANANEWSQSMEHLIRNAEMRLLKFVSWPLPTLRNRTTYVKAMDQGKYKELYY